MIDITKINELMSKGLNKPFRHYKVTFKGETYWLHDYNLSPLDHYSDEGELIVNPFGAISFAVVQNGIIMRFGEPLGLESELVKVE